MEYSPPPLFKQGASARAKVVIFSLIAVALLFIDARLQTLTMIRQGVGIVLYPLQVVALMPRDAAYAVAGYFSSLSSLQKENEELKRERVANAQVLQQGQYLAAENVHLRALLAAAERVPVKSIMSEILYDTRDAFTRKIVVDRGEHHGVTRGQPVIDDIGVVGQVTRVFPFTSEVTLLTDKEFAIPVQVVRSGVRSVAYGRGQSGVLDLRFMPTNADIQKGDTLVTTGIDGVYPPGLSVATVTDVESKSSDAFARIICQPSAGIGRNKQLLILLPETKLPPHPVLEEANERKDKPVKKRAPDAAKEPAKAILAPEVKADAPATSGENPGVRSAAANATAAPASKPQMPGVAAPGSAARNPVANQAPDAASPVKQAVPVQAVVKQQGVPAPKAPAQEGSPQAAPARAAAPNPTVPKQNQPAQ